MEDVRCYIIAKNKNVIRNMALPINIENLLGGLVVEGNRVECKIRKIIKI